MWWRLVYVLTVVVCVQIFGVSALVSAHHAVAGPRAVQDRHGHGHRHVDVAPRLLRLPHRAALGQGAQEGRGGVLRGGGKGGIIGRGW